MKQIRKKGQTWVASISPLKWYITINQNLFFITLKCKERDWRSICWPSSNSDRRARLEEIFWAIWQNITASPFEIEKGIFTQDREFFRYLSFFPKSGRSKGYGFIEFEDAKEGKIAAKTMDKYLFHERLLQCKMMNKEQLAEDFWKGSNQRFQVGLVYRKARTEHNKKASAKNAGKFILDKKPFYGFKSGFQIIGSRAMCWNLSHSKKRKLFQVLFKYFWWNVNVAKGKYFRTEIAWTRKERRSVNWSVEESRGDKLRTTGNDWKSGSRCSAWKKSQEDEEKNICGGGTERRRRDSGE